MKTPDIIKYSDDENGDILQQDRGEVIKNIVKQYKVKPVEGKPATEVVKDLLTMAFRAKDEDIELPEDMEHLQKVADYCKELAKGHREICDKEAEEEKQKKALKAQQKTLEKEAKEKEDKQYVENAAKFEEVLARKIKASEEKVSANVVAAVKAINLPKTISVTGNGMGIVLSESASKDDIATATASMMSAAEGNGQMMGALQFLIGDIVNASVDKKVFRTKGDACKNVKYLVEEKLNKKFSAGAINANSLMAERIKPQDRKIGVLPSVYLAASKVVAPRIKELSEKDAAALVVKFDEGRNNMISLINDGTITSIKDCKEYEIKLKQEAGLNISQPGEAGRQIQRFLRRLFWATWAKRNLVDPETGIAKFHERDCDEKAPAVEYTVGQLTDIEEEALNNLQNLFLVGEDVPSIIKGYTEVVDEKTKAVAQVPNLLDDPFEDPKPKDKKEEGKKDKEKKEDKPKSKSKPEPEEEEEEEDEKDEDEDEDGDEDEDDSDI